LVGCIDRGSIGKPLVAGMVLDAGLAGGLAVRTLFPGQPPLLALCLCLEKAIEQRPLFRKRVRHRGLFAASHQSGRWFKLKLGYHCHTIANRQQCCSKIIDLWAVFALGGNRELVQPGQCMQAT